MMPFFFLKNRDFPAKMTKRHLSLQHKPNHVTMKFQTIKNELINPKNYKGMNTGHFLCLLAMGLFLLLLLPYAYDILCEFLSPKKSTFWRQLSYYKWAAAGCIGYYYLRRWMKNVRILEAFSHEFTHMIVALIFRRRIHSFECKSDGSGLIYTSGNNKLGYFLMTLAPYCFPVLTYLLMVIRPLLRLDGLRIFDVFVGMTIAFHFYCFKKQTSINQPDIQEYPPMFSILFIAVTTLMNICIIWVAFLPDYPLFTSIWRMICAVWHNFIAIF